MLHAGLDLSRRRLDVCLLDEQGGTVQVTSAPPDADGLRGLARQVATLGGPVLAAIGRDHRGPLAKNGPEYLRWGGPPTTTPPLGRGLAPPKRPGAAAPPPRPWHAPGHLDRPGRAGRADAP